jgi:hypothetical protein
LDIVGVHPSVVGMTSDAISAPEHEHSDAWPHDDTHHVVAAFALLLFERGVETIEGLSVRLSEYVARGPIDGQGLDRLIANLERTGLVESRCVSSTGRTYRLTASGRTFVDDWARIMRDRRRLSRSFLALYDRTDE